MDQAPDPNSTSLTLADAITNNSIRQPLLSRANLPVSADNNSGVAQATASLQSLHVQERSGNLIVNGSSSMIPDRSRTITNRESGSDGSQRADSSSELGVKPASLDGKSITSGTTFALDEKESLRPDDSASVKAAAEDDDSFSIRGSFVAGSRMSSDIALMGRLATERRLMRPPSGLSGPEVMTPQSASSEPPLPEGLEPSDALNVIYRQAPDEKLLEALASPRARFFLLRLEKDVIDFVQDSK